MPHDEARIPPLTPDEWSDDQREMLERVYRRSGFYNVVGTLSRHPEASRRIGQVSAHVIGPTSTLPPRDRELLILRTAWRCRSGYVWAQHVLLGEKAGLAPDEIARCRVDPPTGDPADSDAVLLHAADELHAQQCVGDATWAALAARYDERQLMDIVFAVGQYTLISMALNAFGTPLDEGLQAG